MTRAAFQAVLAWWTLDHTKSVFTLLASGVAIVVAFSALALLARAEVELDDPFAGVEFDRDETVAYFEPEEPPPGLVSYVDEFSDGMWNPFSEFAAVYAGAQPSETCTEDPRGKALADVYGLETCLSGEIPGYAIGLVDFVEGAYLVRALMALEASKYTRLTVIVSNLGSATARDVRVYPPRGCDLTDPADPFDLPPSRFLSVSCRGKGLTADPLGSETLDVPLLVRQTDSFVFDFNADASAVINQSAVIAIGLLMGFVIASVVVAEIRRDLKAAQRKDDRHSVDRGPLVTP
jgi:hypothetical protein